MESDEQYYNDAMTQLIDWENEVRRHNEGILKTIKYNLDDFNELMEDGCTVITGKMEWVEKPKFKQEIYPDVFGVFTLTHVDQWTIGTEGDSFEGFMYVKVDGFDRWLKIPYSC